MTEVRLKALEIVELDDGGEWKIVDHQRFVGGAMCDARADLETAYCGNALCGRVQRIEHRIPIGLGYSRLRPEQHNVQNHYACGSRRFSFSTSVVRFKFSSFDARPLLPPVFSNARRIKSCS